MLMRIRLAVLLLLLLILGGCADKQALRLGPQYWQGIEFVVETRPTPIREGMNEFIVIASREKGRPGVGLIVSIRVDDNAEWRQGIQDGYTGVYRRAIHVTDPQRDVLAVQVLNTKAGQGEEAETVLFFPLGTGN